jgi:hypothetical protein
MERFSDRFGNFKDASIINEDTSQEPAFSLFLTPDSLLTKVEMSSQTFLHP